MHGCGVNTTAFGLGAGFNQNVMEGIARLGQGNFIFVGNAIEIPQKVLRLELVYLCQYLGQCTLIPLSYHLRSTVCVCVCVFVCVYVTCAWN
jgi:hypothetical protein